MEHYKKQAAIAFDKWQYAMDTDNTRDIKKYYREYVNYQELIKQAQLQK